MKATVSVATENGDVFGEAANKDMIIYTASNGQNILIGNQEDGVAGLRMTSNNIYVRRHILPTTDDAYDLGSSELRFRDLTLSGNFTVHGTTTTLNTETVLIEDNKITLNSSQVGAPSSNLVSGVEVERGTLSNYMFIFEEATDLFKIGMSGDTLQAVATRSDQVEHTTIPFWNSNLNRFDFSSNVKINSSTGSIFATSFVGDGSQLTGIVGTSGVKRFMEQTAGGRNPYDCIVVIDNEDNVRAIGLNDHNRFGPGANLFAPGIIMALPNNEIASKVYVTRRNVYILSTLGNVYVTGNNTEGQAALPAGSGTANVITPTATAVTNCSKVILPTGTTGAESVMFLTNDGKVYSAGLNNVGQLGIGTTTNSTNKNPELTLGPGNLYGNPTEVVLDVIGVGGNNGTNTRETYCALLADGTVCCVGCGDQGQMGNGTTTVVNSSWIIVQNSLTPGTALQNVTHIHGCGRHSLTSFYALTYNGVSMYSWGYGGQGQLGHGDLNDQTRAKLVPAFGNGTITQVYAFNSVNSSVIVQRSDNRFYACGYNGYGQLGLGDTTSRSSFTLIDSLMNKSIEKLFICGPNAPHVWAKSETGKLYSAGHNGQGQTGLLSTSTNINTFTEVNFKSASSIVDVIPLYSEGIGGFTVILTSDGNTYFTGQTRFNYAGLDREIYTFAKNTANILG